MKILILAMVLLLPLGTAQAQNSFLFGTTDARKCYDAAQLAGTLAKEGLESCNDALKRGRLSRNEKASTLVNRGILHTHFGDFEDIFSSFFGGGGGGGSIFDAFFGGGGGSRGPRVQRGSDLRYDFTITLKDTVTGKESAIEVPRLDKCGTCGGSGQKDRAAPKKDADRPT